MAKVASPDPSRPAVDDEADDYMSMTIIEPTQPLQKETYTQRRIRKQREAEQKSRHQVEPAASLSTAISTTSKGFQMLSKLGYTPGSTLGAAGNKNAPLEPVMLEMKEDRGGVGLANEKKRKLRQAFEEIEQGEKAEQGGFRERVAREREEKRTEGQVVGAMKVLEGLEEETETRAAEKGKKKKVNVLYRGIVRQRQERERERRAKYDLHQSLSRNPTYEDEEDEEEERRLVWGEEEEDVEEEDEELEAFERLEPRKKLQRLVEELRKMYWYCFWCKHRYGNESMEGCPGVGEDDHD